MQYDAVEYHTAPHLGSACSFSSTCFCFRQPRASGSFWASSSAICLSLSLPAAPKQAALSPPIFEVYYHCTKVSGSVTLCIIQAKCTYAASKAAKSSLYRLTRSSISRAPLSGPLRSTWPSGRNFVSVSSKCNFWTSLC